MIETTTRTLKRAHLEDARRLILEVGWNVGTAASHESGEETGYCLGGAIAKAISGNTHDMYHEGSVTWYALQEFILSAGIPFESTYSLTRFADTIVYKWNDAENRTVEEVIALIDSVIESLPEE